MQASLRHTCGARLWRGVCDDLNPPAVSGRDIKVQFSQGDTCGDPGTGFPADARRRALQRPSPVRQDPDLGASRPVVTQAVEAAPTLASPGCERQRQTQSPEQQDSELLAGYNEVRSGREDCECTWRPRHFGTAAVLEMQSLIQRKAPQTRACPQRLQRCAATPASLSGTGRHPLRKGRPQPRPRGPPTLEFGNPGGGGTQRRARPLARWAAC